MIKYSLVLLAAAAVFSGCSEDECCYSGIAPTAVIAEADNRTVVAGVAMAFTGAASSDNDGTVQGYSWTVDGAEVAQGSGGVQALNHTFATAGNHEVCLVVTDNDDLNSKNKECRTVEVTVAPTNAQPVASFTPTTCDSGTDVEITGVGIDDDNGDVISYAWTNADSATITTGNPYIVACPASGERKEVCLTVTDDSGSTNASSTQVCHDIKANTSLSTKSPIVVIEKGVSTGDGQNFVCSNVHDDDNIVTTVGTYPYGSNSPTDIKEVTWVYTYYKEDNTIEDGPNEKTQTQFNIDNNKTSGTCVKWFHINADVATIKLSVTVVDDDNQTSTKSYTYTKDGDALVAD